tara:strand:+ start:1613 stop:1771 length:159 start_codon:yes stop_codon:yes gene_type:complete
MSKQEKKLNAVYFHLGGWYFFDNTGKAHGSFGTKKKADKMLRIHLNRQSNER